MNPCCPLVSSTIYPLRMYEYDVRRHPLRMYEYEVRRLSSIAKPIREIIVRVVREQVHHLDRGRKNGANFSRTRAVQGRHRRTWTFPAVDVAKMLVGVADSAEAEIAVAGIGTTTAVHPTRTPARALARIATRMLPTAREMRLTITPRTDPTASDAEIRGNCTAACKAKCCKGCRGRGTTSKYAHQRSKRLCWLSKLLNRMGMTW